MVGVIELLLTCMVALIVVHYYAIINVEVMCCRVWFLAWSGCGFATSSWNLLQHMHVIAYSRVQNEYCWI